MTKSKGQWPLSGWTGAISWNGPRAIWGYNASLATMGCRCAMSDSSSRSTNTASSAKMISTKASQTRQHWIRKRTQWTIRLSRQRSQQHPSPQLSCHAIYSQHGDPLSFLTPASWIYQMRSKSWWGHNWRKAGAQLWHIAIDKICDDCIPKMCQQKDQNDLIQRALMDELKDIIITILDDHSVSSTLLFDPDFAAMLKPRVHSREHTRDMPLATCTGSADVTTSLRYPHPALHHSTFMMPPPSLAGVGLTIKVNSKRQCVSHSQICCTPDNQRCWNTNDNSPRMKGIPLEYTSNGFQLSSYLSFSH